MVGPILYSAFGLDMSDHSIKVVQLYNVSYIHRHPQFRLGPIASIPLTPGLIANGELQKPEEVRAAIQDVLGMKKANRTKRIKGYWVVASIPEAQSFLKLIQLNSHDDISDTLIQELAKQHIPFEENNYYLDWQVFPGSTPDTPPRILLSATERMIADSYTYLLESLGFGVIALEPESIAVARAMITAQKEYGEQARMVLDIGATDTGVIVYDDNMIQFSTTLPFSGEILTQLVASKLALSPEEAEKKLHTDGIEYEKSPLWTTLSSAIDTFASDIKQSVEFYYSHFPHAHQINRITLCGGVANLKFLDQVLTTKLSIETKPGNPWKNVSPKVDVPKKETGLSYATAIGLALRASDSPILRHDSV